MCISTFSIKVEPVGAKRAKLGFHFSVRNRRIEKQAGQNAEWPAARSLSLACTVRARPPAENTRVSNFATHLPRLRSPPEQ